MPDNPNPPAPLDLTKLKVFPLEQRISQTTIEEIAIKPDSAPPNCDAENLRVASLLGAEMPFMECDDEADYARLTQHFYPDLIARG